MASKRIKGITIEIDGDSTKLVNALKSVDKALYETQGNLKDIDKLLKFDPSNTELLSQKQKNLEGAISGTKDRLEELKKAQDGVEQGSADWDALQREIIETEQNLKGLEKEYKEFGSVGKQQALVVAEKMKEVGETISSAGEKMQEVGTKATAALTLPIIGGLTAAVKTAGDFDKSMSKVEAISGATAEQMQQLRDTAMDMAEQTKFTSSEMADALSYMAMAGWDASQMMDGLAGITYLAAAADEDLAMVSDIVTDGLTAFGLAAEDSAHFADVLAKTAASANTNVQMMGASFKYVAPVAGAMGYSIEDISVALGLMANSGIKADQAGTSLRNLMQRMAKETKESGMAIDALGLHLDDGQGNMYSFMEIMEQLRDGFGNLMYSSFDFQLALQEMNEALEAGNMKESEYEKELEDLIRRTYGAEAAEKARYAAMLAGARAMPALLAIVNSSEEDFEKLTAAVNSASDSYAQLEDGSIVPMSEALKSGQQIIQEYNGAAEGMSNIMMNNLPGQIDVVKSKLEKLAITFGEDVMPVVSQAVDKIQELMDNLNAMDEGQRRTILTIAAIVAAIGPALTILGSLITVIGGVATAMGAITAAAAALNIAAGPLVLIITGIIVAIAGLTAGIIYLYNNWETVSQGIKDTWTSLITFLSECWESIKMHVSEAIINLEESWDKIKHDASESFNTMKNNVATTFSNMWKSVADRAAAIKESVVNTFNDAVAYITSLPEQALSWGRDIIQGVIDGIMQKVEALKQTISGVAQAIKDFIGFSEPDKGPLSNFHTYMPDMIDLMTEGITAGIPEIENAMSVLASAMKQDLNMGSMTAATTTGNVVNINTTVTLNGGYTEDAADMIVGVINQKLGKLYG